MSLLLEHGHHDAFEYAVGRVWNESRLIRRRLRAALADQATMMHAVVIGALTNVKHLQEFLKELEQDGH